MKPLITLLFLNTLVFPILGQDLTDKLDKLQNDIIGTWVLDSVGIKPSIWQEDFEYHFVDTSFAQSKLEFISNTISITTLSPPRIEFPNASIKTEATTRNGKWEIQEPNGEYNSDYTLDIQFSKEVSKRYRKESFNIFLLTDQTMVLRKIDIDMVSGLLHSYKYYFSKANTIQ